MNSKMEGLVFDIQRFSLHDGPGIRTTVFLKGCPLRCAWCHNPESQSEAMELAYYPERCVACGSCVSACPNGCHVLDDGPGHALRRADCTVCGICAKVCHAGALSIVGRMRTVEDVMDEVMADHLFYQVSGGGMTVSGGEPMAQPAFTLALLKAAKALGLHICLDTCGFCAPEDLLLAIPHTDLFLFDLKTSADIHEHWTGVPLEPILRSLHALDDAGGMIRLRCPLIPGVNMTEAHLENIAGVVASLNNISGIDIVPYHPVGESKQKVIGREMAIITSENDAPAPLAMSEAEKWADRLREKTFLPVTVI